MAVYKVIEIGDDILREKARLVPRITPNIIKLLDNMADTMYSARPRGVGLAAPQIGISKRVIVVDVGEGMIEMINPEIVKSYGKETDSEACLSVPGLIGDVNRAASVKVKGFDRNGAEFSVKAKGLLARVFQHEIDHLEGILFVDLATNLRNIESKD